MKTKAELLPGTLDLLILKAVSLSPQHGYGVLQRIEQITGGALTIEQGALYPALYRLEHQGGLASEWGTSDSNRRAKSSTDPERSQATGGGNGRLESVGRGDGGGAQGPARGGLTCCLGSAPSCRPFFAAPAGSGR